MQLPNLANLKNSKNFVRSSYGLEGLRGTGPNGYFLANDTSKIFGPDGITPVSAPGDAVYIVSDAWEEIETGPELVTGGATLGSGWSGTGPWVKAAGAANSATWSVGTLVSGKTYAVEIAYSALTASTITPRLTGGATLAGNAVSAAGTYRGIFVATAAHTTLDLLTTATTAGTVASVSVREVLNWPSFQPTSTAQSKWGWAPAEVRNLIKYSEDFSGAVWTTYDAFVTSGAILGPDGITLADKLTETAANGQHNIQQIIPFISNTPYTAEIEVKSEGGRKLGIVFPSALFGEWLFASFELSGAGSIITKDAPVTASIISLGGGWYRCTAKATPLYSGNYPVAYKIQKDGLSQSESYLGDGVSGLYLTKAQVLSNGPVSEPPYQKTTTSHDITELGVPSLGKLAFDLSDDKLTLLNSKDASLVWVAIHTRGGSYRYPAPISVAAAKQLVLGPTSLVNDGVQLNPRGVMRIGIQPWSAFSEVVGWSVFSKTTPTEDDWAREMRYYKAKGAKGWLVETPVVSYDFNAGLNGFTANGSTLSNPAGRLRITKSGASAAFASSPAIAVTPGIPHIYNVDFVTDAAVLDSYYSAGPVPFNGSFAVDTMLTVGTYQLLFIPSGPVVHLSQNSNSGAAIGEYNELDNISLAALTPEF